MDTEDSVRRSLEVLLLSGLRTEWRERAYSSDDVNRVVAQLQQLNRSDYASKLRVAGFTEVPYEAASDNVGMSQSCETCMYYVTHRQFCELPELQLPVRPEWSCRLWRI